MKTWSQLLIRASCAFFAAMAIDAALLTSTVASFAAYLTCSPTFRLMTVGLRGQEGLAGEGSWVIGSLPGDGRLLVFEGSLPGDAAALTLLL